MEDYPGIKLALRLSYSLPNRSRPEMRKTSIKLAVVCQSHRIFPIWDPFLNNAILLIREMNRGDDHKQESKHLGGGADI
jgi:hypothetical protein